MSMAPEKSEQLEEQWQAAEEALRAAQVMPVGPERIAALKKAGQMRFDVLKRKYPAKESKNKGE
jgi:hypothetical protein